MDQVPAVPVGARTLVDVGGRRLHVWQAGTSGPVVLLVHGIPTNHLLWHDVVLGLHEHCRVVAVDLLGYGWSDAPGDWPVDLASQAGYLLALLDALDVERCTVVGHDLGGGIAQILATAASGRVQALGLVDAVCFEAWPVPVVRALKAVWPLVGLLPPAALAAGLGRGLRALFVHQDRADVFLPRLTAPWLHADGPRRLTRHLRSLDSVFTQAVAPFLPRLTVPVEVVWGRQDHQMKPVHGQRLADTIPQARLTWVPDASHLVPADTPQPVVDAALRLLAEVEQH